MNSGHHTLVAEEDNKIIGTATLVVGWKLFRGGIKHGRVSDVATHPDWVGKGVGSKLMEEIIKEAFIHGCYKLTLGCNEKNVGWYECFGFRRHEVAMRIDLPQAKM